MKIKAERRAILLSIWANLLAAALGLVFAWITNSEAVLIDGVYSLINFSVAILSLKVAEMVERPDDELYPFGYVAYEPVLNLSKGLLILLVAVFGLFSSTTALFSGGRAVDAIDTCVYAVLATALCGGATWYLRRQSRKTHSPIVAVDAKNWWIDTLISAGVVVAFGVAVVVDYSPWPWLSRYVDPVVVITLVVVMLPVPWKIIRENWGQIVARAVEPECFAQIEKRLAEVRSEAAWTDQHLRVVRTGRVLYVHLYIVGGPATIAEADTCRERIRAALEGLHPDVALDVSFTGDASWVRLASGDS